MDLFSHYRNYDEIKRFLNENQSINININDKHGFTILRLAIINDDVRIVKLLLNHEYYGNKIDINQHSIFRFTPLMTTCHNNKTEILDLLLNHKDININTKDSFNNSVLYYNYNYNNFDNIQKLLLDYRTNVNELDNRYIVDKNNSKEDYLFILFRLSNNKKFEHLKKQLINEKLDKLSKNKKLLIYCADGIPFKIFKNKILIKE